MKKTTTLLILFFLGFQLFAQNKSELSIEKIMQNPAISIGTSPSNIHWAEDGSKIYFKWNPENNPGSSLYAIDSDGDNLRKVSVEEIQNKPAQSGVYNQKRSKKIYTKNGDIFIYDIKDDVAFQVTQTSTYEYNPHFNLEETKIAFVSDNNLFTWDIVTGQIDQVTNFSARPKSHPESSNDQNKWLENQQENFFQVLKDRQEKADFEDVEAEKIKIKKPKRISNKGKSIQNLTLSPDEKFVTYRIGNRNNSGKRTIVPNYVTESGYTEEINARTKVGSPQQSYNIGVFDVEKDSAYTVDLSELPGIKDDPKYFEIYKRTGEGEIRKIIPHGPYWSEDGNYCVYILRSLDNKDRWIILLDPETGKIKNLDRQHDDAWVGGPGISGWNFYGGNVGWMPDNKRFWFQSEATGFSHLYWVDVETRYKKQLTNGKFEIHSAQISKDKKHWYYTSSEVHPGERHFYKMPIEGGISEKLTSMTGENQVELSPDEKQLAIRFSFSNKPWELFIQKNKLDEIPQQITESHSEQFRSYNWRIPEIITFKASDNAEVYARLYRPKNPQKQAPAVIFVHGAGYLQNAHKRWSSYYREYMFHNFLVDNGYTVLDIDYRGSAGYGRDCRTGIYRHMGGKDLSDQVDGAKMLVEKYDISPDRIGMYGGSYGGFITLMALFTEPGTFRAGAALRSVTDWAHYNHAYTSNILNTPVLDSIAYAQSSPIYFAEGLQDNLLICHGMIDDNVHFQDVVRLSQRLIELGKNDWELAVYPLEPHGFKEPSSWTDEYKRIFKLFERELK